MYKSQIVDMFIILFGVLMAWVCAWKAHHYFNLDQFPRALFYVFAVIMLLIIVVVEAVRVTP